LIVWLVLGVMVEMKWFGWTTEQYEALLGEAEYEDEEE
jgi:hypothetical protein